MIRGSPITSTIDVLRQEYRSGETVGGRREKHTAMWDWPWRIEVRGREREGGGREGGRREGGREEGGREGGRREGGRRYTVCQTRR